MKKTPFKHVAIVALFLAATIACNNDPQPDDDDPLTNITTPQTSIPTEGITPTSKDARLVSIGVGACKTY